MTIQLFLLLLDRRFVRTQSTVAAPRLAAQPKENWFSDPSTYPLIVIMATAGSFCVGFSAYKLAYCPDVRITKNTKGKVMRNW